MAGPLAGTLVVDLTRLLPGPFCTQLLADYGAKVVKVEDPVLGDYMRMVPPQIDDTSYPFAMVNRKKKSLAVDLKTPEGRQVLHRLVAKADVFVEQFRTGVAARLGADPDALLKVNPRLVYVAFEGFGLDGPYAGRPGHDIDFEALAGILGVTGVQAGRPVISGVPIADLAAAYNAAFQILVALRRRDATGRGQVVDVSIFDTALSLMVLNLARYLGTGEMPEPGEILVAGQWPFYNVYETKDGRWLSIAVVETKFWRRLVEILGLPDLAEEQFADEARRKQAIAAFRAAFRAKTLEEWTRILGEDLPWAPVLTVPEVVRDPHVAARRMIVDADLGRLGRRKVLNHPAIHRGVDRDPSGTVPARGEHTDEILRGLGYGPAAIQDLRRRGILGP